MIARVTRLQAKLDKLDEFKKYFDSDVLPVLKKKKGFRNGYLLADRKTGKCLSIGIWDDETGIQADEKAGGYQGRINDTQKYYTAPTVREIYEIVSQG
jgi:quinol monooxygenase YgiN